MKCQVLFETKIMQNRVSSAASLPGAYIKKNERLAPVRLAMAPCRLYMSEQSDLVELFVIYPKG